MQLLNMASWFVIIYFVSARSTLRATLRRICAFSITLYASPPHPSSGKLDWGCARQSENLSTDSFIALDAWHRVRSAEIVFSASLFEQVQLLEWLKTVNSLDKFCGFWHTEGLHVILQLDVVENHGSDVMSILLCQSLVWWGFNSGNQSLSIVLNGVADLGAKLLSVEISFSLGERDTEGHVVVNLLEIGSNGSQESTLRIFLNLGSLGSSSFMGSNFLFSDGICSNIWECRDELNSTVVVSLEHCGFSWDGEECKNAEREKLHFANYKNYYKSIIKC